MSDRLAITFINNIEDLMETCNIFTKELIKQTKYEQMRDPYKIGKKNNFRIVKKACLEVISTNRNSFFSEKL